MVSRKKEKKQEKEQSVHKIPKIKHKSSENKLIRCCFSHSSTMDCSDMTKMTLRQKQHYLSAYSKLLLNVRGHTKGVHSRVLTEDCWLLTFLVLFCGLKY